MQASRSWWGAKRLEVYRKVCASGVIKSNKFDGTDERTQQYSLAAGRGWSRAQSHDACLDDGRRRTRRHATAHRGPWAGRRRSRWSSFFIAAEPDRAIPLGEQPRQHFLATRRSRTGKITDYTSLGNSGWRTRRHPTALCGPWRWHDAAVMAASCGAARGPRGAQDAEAERRPRAPEGVRWPPSASEWMPRPRAAAYRC